MAVLARVFPRRILINSASIFAGEALVRFATFLMAVVIARRFGSAALDLAWVAAGRYDAFWERGLSAWDIAAGILMIREAHGVATDLDGRDRMLQSGDILAANDTLHPKMLKLLKAATKSQVGG